MLTHQIKHHVTLIHCKSYPEIALSGASKLASTYFTLFYRSVHVLYNEIVNLKYLYSFTKVMCILVHILYFHMHKQLAISLKPTMIRSAFTLVNHVSCCPIILQLRCIQICEALFIHHGFVFENICNPFQ